MKSKSGERTLLASVVMSSPGPIVVGFGLLLGKSSTQLADFIRRTAELIAIIVAWVVFRMTSKDGVADAARKTRLEETANRCVGLAMCLSGAVMMLIAFLPGSTDKGNVIPGLIIAILGVTTNSWFWLRYRNLDRANPNAILAVQSRLYRGCSLSVRQRCAHPVGKSKRTKPHRVTFPLCYVLTRGSLAGSHKKFWYDANSSLLFIPSTGIL